MPQKEILPANYTTTPAWDGRGGYITTYSGLQFYFAEPTVDMITIDDIAHALSMICHFGGHTAQFFSVAQHSVLVELAAKYLGWDRPFRQWALMHDTAEAYIGDMTRPLKYLLPEYKILEQRIMHVIAEKFGLTSLNDAQRHELKRIDDSILKLEARMCMTHAILHDGSGKPYDLPDPPPITAHWTAPMTQATAKSMFRRQFEFLFRDDDGL